MDKGKLEQELRTDISKFGAFCLPTVVELEFPDYYKWLFFHLVNLAIEEKEEKLGLGLPRGYAKTTLLKVLVIYFIVYRLKKYILIVCSTEDRARDFLTDLDNILRGDNIRGLYLNWEDCLVTDTKESKEYRMRYRENGKEVQKMHIVQAIGAGTSIRGVNKYSLRPDFILLDDAQTRENAESPAASGALYRWMFGTLLKTVNRSGSLVAFVGNMYNEDCILNVIKNSAEWTTLITGSILDDGESIWPEFRSVESIYKEYVHDASVGAKEIFFTECQNSVVSDGAGGILNNARWEIKKVREEEVDGGFLVIDPAAYKPGSDKHAIITVHMSDFIGYIKKIDNVVMTPLECIELAIERVLEYRLSCIAIESTAYQSTLKFWLERELLMRGLSEGIEIVELSPKNRTKSKRIIGWLQSMFDRYFEIENVEDLNRIEWQARKYRIDRQVNEDDVLDGCAYCSDVVADFQHAWYKKEYSPVMNEHPGYLITRASIADARRGRRL